MPWTPNIRKGTDQPTWDWQNFSPVVSRPGTASAYDGSRFIYWAIQSGSDTAASTSQLYRFDTWTEGWQFLATLTNSFTGLDVEYDAVRNVVIVIHGNSLTSWQCFNLNATSIVYANVTLPAWTITTMTPVLPAAAPAASSITMPDELATIGSLTVDGAVDIDTGTADAVGNTTTTIVTTPATGTFGPGMVGLMVRVNTGAQAGQRRVIQTVTNKQTLTVSPALPGALAAGDTFEIELPEHTVSAATTTTVTNSTSGTWPVNHYGFSDVVFITGALAGQRRRIASNTADTLTLAAAVTGNPRTGPLTGTPAVGDIFRIVPSSDFLYYQPGGSTGLYRLDVTQTTGIAWSAVLAASPAASGGGANTVFAGKYDPFSILMVRGVGTNTVYRYGIGPNSWTTLTTFGGAEVFNTGAAVAMVHGRRRIFVQIQGSQRCVAYDLTTGMLEPFGFLPYAAPSAHDGKRARFVSTPDGVEWLYLLRAGGQEFFRVPLDWLP